MNEYLSIVEGGGLIGDPCHDLSLDLDTVVGRRVAREALVCRFAWAIPNDEAIDAISALAPIVEVGAGSGYWTKLLRLAGASVVPYDAQPYPLFNTYVSHSYVPVAKGTERAALRHGREEWTLMLCWPPYGSPMAERSLRLHQGRYVVYVGEGPYGCTANEEFHVQLDRRYDEVERITIPQWFGLHDYVSIWRRKLPKEWA